jgi:hypothetical protein
MAQNFHTEAYNKRINTSITFQNWTNRKQWKSTQPRNKAERWKGPKYQTIYITLEIKEKGLWLVEDICET